MSNIPLITGQFNVSQGDINNLINSINAGLSAAGIQSITPVALTTIERDKNANAFANNFISSSANVTGAGGTTILTAASARQQVLTGSSAQTFQLPNATTLAFGANYVFNNNSSATLTVTNNGSSTIATVPAGGYLIINLLDNSTANGSWDGHPSAPLTVTWGSGTTGLVFNTALNTTPSISAGVSSAANPSFIPQRGSNTTGYGGDSTHLYGSIGGSAAFTSTATNFTVPALNKVTVTAPASGSTLTIADGKTLTASNTITLTGTDNVSMNVTNSKVRTIGFSVSSASLTTGQQGGYVVVPVSGTITGWNIMVNAGTATVQTWKVASGIAVPTAGNSISTAGVAISTGTAIESTNTSDFTTTTVTAGDIFAFNLSAVSGVTTMQFQLQITVN